MVINRIGITHPLAQFREEMDRIVSNVVGTLPVAESYRAAWGREFPAINVYEDGDALYCEAELPGLDVKDVEITVVGNELTIKGQRGETQRGEAVFHRRERQGGPFSRLLKLPYEIDAERVTATLRDGILRVTLPKAEAAKPRKIKVAVAGE